MTTRLPTIDVMKLDEIDAPPRTVFRDLEQIDDAGKPRVTGYVGRHVGEGNLKDLRDDDFARRQGISTADLYVRPLPEANGGSDLAPTDSIPKATEKLHVD